MKAWLVAAALAMGSCGQVITSPSELCGARPGVQATMEFIDSCVYALTRPQIHASRATILEYAGKDEVDVANCIRDEVRDGTLAKDDDRPRW